MWFRIKRESEPSVKEVRKSKVGSKKGRDKRTITYMDIAHAISWINDEERLSDVAREYDVSDSHGYILLARALKEAYKRGYLRLGPERRGSEQWGLKRKNCLESREQ